MIVPKEIVAQLRDYQTWAEANKGMDLFDYATLAVGPDQFLALLEVIEPELVVHNGEYFRAREFTLSGYDAWAQELKTPQQIQRVMNHLHVSQFFREEDVSYAVLKFIAGAIARHWTRAFADKGLVAEAYGDGVDVEVTLFRP